MGFGTSGALAIILVGSLIAASVFIPTMFDVGSATGDAFSSKVDTIRDSSNTAVSVQAVERNETERTVNVTVSNDGTNTLDLTRTNVLLNGELIPIGETETSVTNATDPGGEPIAETKLWPPGTDLQVVVSESTLGAVTDEIDQTEDVERVLIVTENGITDAANAPEAT